jgi:hypothetical protein
VEDVSACTPCDTETRMVGVTGGIRLILDTRLVQVVSADRARILMNVFILFMAHNKTNFVNKITDAEKKTI